MTYRIWKSTVDILRIMEILIRTFSSVFEDLRKPHLGTCAARFYQKLHVVAGQTEFFMIRSMSFFEHVFNKLVKITLGELWAWRESQGYGFSNSDLFTVM